MLPTGRRTRSGDFIDRPLTVPAKPRYPIRGLADPVPSFPRRCGSARPHRMPGTRSRDRSQGHPGGLRPTRPILPAMRRLLVLLALATLLASCAGTTGAGADKPVRILTGEPTTLDPAAQGDAGSAAITAQLFESLTTFDARPAGPAGARRIVAVRRRRPAGDVPSSTESDVLRRQPAPPLGRRPKLAPDHRSDASIAAGLAGARHQGRRRLPARRIVRSGERRAPRR